MRFLLSGSDHLSFDLYTAWGEGVKGSKAISFQPSAFSKNKEKLL